MITFNGMKGMSARDRRLFKTLAFVAWPFFTVIAVLGMLLSLAAIVLVWPLIPFCSVEETKTGINLKLF